MVLNNKILNAMENNEPKNIERSDEIYLDMLHDSVEHEKLTLLEFTTLADMYNVEYKVTLESKIQVLTFDNNSKMMFWEALDELYYQLTCNRLHSANLTLDEVVEKFNKLYVSIKID